MSARQFGKLYWGGNASLAARAIAARVEYRCYAGQGKPPAQTEIVESDFVQALGLGRTATRNAIGEALEKGLITRQRSVRGDGRGVFVYLPVAQEPDHVDEHDTFATRTGHVREQDTTRSPREPVTSASKTRHVRQSDSTCLESEPDTFANHTGHVRKQDFSDPPPDPVEPGEEPVEPSEERATPTPKANAQSVECGSSEAPECPDPRPGSQAPDPLVAEHRRIVDRQAEMAEQRERSKAEIRRMSEATRRAIPSATDRPVVTDEIWHAVVNHSLTAAFANDQASQWSRALGEFVGGYDVAPDELRAVLEHLASERKRLRATLVGCERNGEIPTVGELWYAKGPRGRANREWLLSALDRVRRQHDPARLSHDDRFAQQAEWRRRERDAMYDVPPLPEGVV